MVYRELKKNGVSVSLLGYGCMRFPTDINGRIDEAEAEKLLDLAYSRGINYFDTAYNYHSGKSEPFVGRVLSKYDRGSYYIADKLPCWQVKNLDDAGRAFNEQLESLQTDYIDFYLLHTLNKSSWDRMRALAFRIFRQLKKTGQNKVLRFSFHDDFEVFEEILKKLNGIFARYNLTIWMSIIRPGLRGTSLPKSMGVDDGDGAGQGRQAGHPAGRGYRGVEKVNPKASVASWALVGGQPAER